MKEMKGVKLFMPFMSSPAILTTPECSSERPRRVLSP